MGARLWAERLRAERTDQDYETAWARSQVSLQVTLDMDHLAELASTRPEVVAELRTTYCYWKEQARDRLDESAEQFREFSAGTFGQETDSPCRARGH